MEFGRRRGRIVVALMVLGLVSALSAPEAFACASIPAPIVSIDAIDYRQGPAGTVDSALKARNDVAMEPVRTYVRLVSTAADRYLAEGQPSTALCALSGLAQWARARALLGPTANVQAERERAAIVGGLAFAYLKTRIGSSAADRVLIDAWLDELASAVESGFDDNAPPGNRSLELAGLGSLAVGAATGNREHWRFGQKAYEHAIGAIDADGVLTTAMSNGERALFDQNFALGELVMMAELAARQSDEDWYQEGDGAVHRLADRVLDGLYDPAWFAERSGKNQFLPSGRDLAWIAFYARRFPARFAGRVPDGAIFQLPRLGGDLTVLAERWVKN
jgi:poly(beta-D-mannuronate) lyase